MNYGKLVAITDKLDNQGKNTFEDYFLGALCGYVSEKEFNLALETAKELYKKETGETL